MPANKSEGTGPAPVDLSQRAHRLLIGWLGCSLPFLLYAIAGLRFTAGLTEWKLLDSVSAYYHTGAVGVFIGVLFALSLFLFTYRGYSGVRADQLVGGLGGASALGVALFPTAAPAGLCNPTWWTVSLGYIHYTSAVLLFVSFILFAIWLFRKSSVARRRDRPFEKRTRDDLCLVCGIVMIVCLLWAALASYRHSPIFWPEAIAIEAFAISWLLKGEAYQPVFSLMRRMSRQGRG